MYNTKIEQIRKLVSSLVTKHRYVENYVDLPMNGNVVGDKITVVGEDPVTTYVWYDDNWNVMIDNGGGEGVPGQKGEDGKSAYEIAVENGFVGNEEAWLRSLKGKDGTGGEDGLDYDTFYNPPQGTLASLASEYEIEELIPYFTVKELATHYTLAELNPYFMVLKLLSGFTVEELAEVLTVAKLKTYYALGDIYTYFTVAQVKNDFTISEIAEYYTVEEVKGDFTLSQIWDKYDLGELFPHYEYHELLVYFSAEDLDFYSPLQLVSWQELSEMEDPSSEFDIGDEKTITLTNGEIITLQIYDFDHDDLASSGKAKITFGMKNLMNNERAMNSTNTNAGGWNTSAMRTWLNGDLYDLLPSDLKAVIKPVYKKTANGGNQSGTTVINSNDKVFLFSQVETGLGEANVHAGEGTAYQIFTDNASRIKQRNGSNSSWWSRSPYSSHSYNFRIVLSDGSSNNNNANNSNGVCFGFCV